MTYPVEAHQQAVQLYAQGLSLSQIAVKMRYNSTTIRRWLCKEGVALRPVGGRSTEHSKEAKRTARELRAAGLTLRAIGDRLAVSPSRAHWMLKEPPQ